MTITFENCCISGETINTSFIHIRDRTSLPLHHTYIQQYSVNIIKYIFIFCYSTEGGLDVGEGDCACGEDPLDTCSVCVCVCVRACVCVCVYVCVRVCVMVAWL